MTARAQNTTSAPTCVPETRFCCLKICGWDSGQPFVKSPGSLATITIPAPVHVHERQIPDPRELSIRQIPGGVPGGGGWLLQELTHALASLETLPKNAVTAKTL